MAQIPHDSLTALADLIPDHKEKLLASWRAQVCQLRGQCRWGNWTTETKKSSIWRTTSMKRSKSTGLLT